MLAIIWIPPRRHRRNSVIITFGQGAAEGNPIAGSGVSSEDFGMLSRDMETAVVWRAVSSHFACQIYFLEELVAELAENSGHLESTRDHVLLGTAIRFSASILVGLLAGMVQQIWTLAFPGRLGGLHRPRAGGRCHRGGTERRRHVRAPRLRGDGP
jgi:hypothetical protein